MIKAGGQNSKPLSFFARSIRSRLDRRLMRIILFGSHARGTAHPESDIDCLIVVDRMSNAVKRHIDEAAGETLCRYGAMVSAFPLSESAVKRNSYSPLLINIQREGVVL